MGRIIAERMPSSRSTMNRVLRELDPEESRLEL